MQKEERPVIPLKEEDVVQKGIDLDIERSIQQRAMVGIKPSFPYHYIIMLLIVAHFLFMLYAFSDLTIQIGQLHNKIDSFKTPVHNGITSMAFGKRSNLFTTIGENSQMHLLVPLPVTTDSATIHIEEEPDGRKIEKKVKIQR